MAIQLKKLGVKRYNHNLEAPRSFFSKICTTHSYDDRMQTNLIVKNAGLELCCGGIIGMGETRMQRLELGLDSRRAKSRRMSNQHSSTAKRNAP